MDRVKIGLYFAFIFLLSFTFISFCISYGLVGGRKDKRRMQMFKAQLQKEAELEQQKARLPRTFDPQKNAEEVQNLLTDLDKERDPK